MRARTIAAAITIAVVCTTAAVGAGTLPAGAEALAPVFTLHPADQTSTYPSNAVSFTYALQDEEPASIHVELSCDSGETWETRPHGVLADGRIRIATQQSIDACWVRLVATNEHGSTPSDHAVVYVEWPASITVQPSAPSGLLLGGDTVTLSATASGRPNSYRWQRANVVHFGTIQWTNTTVTTPSWTFTVSPTNQLTNLNRYRLVVTNPHGGVTSQEVRLDVYSRPAVTTHPPSTSAAHGTSATFTTAATGITTPTVAWERSDDEGETWSVVAGATTTTLVVPVTFADHGALFRSRFTNPGGVAYSDPAILSVTGDAAPPTVAATARSTSPLTFGVHGGPVQVDLYATDDLSGVEEITWSASGATTAGPTTVEGSTASVDIDAVGETILTVTATDVAGNTSDPVVTTVVIDPRPIVSISPTASALEPDNGGLRAMYFQVTMSKPSATPVVLGYHTRNGTATGCTSGTCDFAKSGSPAQLQQLTIPAGATSATLAVSVRSDLVVDPDEVFELVLASVGSNARLGHDTGEGHIIDVDGLSDGGKPVLMLTPKNSVIEGDAGNAKAQVLINLSKPLAGPITVTFSSSDLDAIGAAACGGGADYRIVAPQSVVIAAGALSRTIDIAICADATADGDRSFQVTHLPVSAPDGHDLIDVQTPAIVEILDDDTLEAAAS